MHAHSTHAHRCKHASRQARKQTREAQRRAPPECFYWRARVRRVLNQPPSKTCDFALADEYGRLHARAEGRHDRRKADRCLFASAALSLPAVSLACAAPRLWSMPSPLPACLFHTPMLLSAQLSFRFPGPRSKASDTTVSRLRQTAQCWLPTASPCRRQCCCRATSSI